MRIGWRHERLAEIIKQRKIKLETLSEVPGVGRSKETLRVYLTGGREPSFGAGYAIARFIDVHPHYLAGLRDTPGRFPREGVPAA